MFYCRKFLPALLLLTALQAKTQGFKITYSPKTFSGPFSGKVLLYLSKDTKTPKDASIGLPKLNCFAIDVQNVKPNTAVLIDDKAISFPVKLSEIERGEYYVQAVWDRNTGGRSIASSADNMYSHSAKFKFGSNTKEIFTINCTEVIPLANFTESKHAKELKVESKLLSAFHKKPMTIDAAVLLPNEYYTQPNKKFPVLFEVSGYGGNYKTDYVYFSNEDSSSKPIDSFPCIYVFLDGNCAWGHMEYANSEFNGPWGDALVKELIPTLEKSYRCDGAKMLWGHSSGGWSVLWLLMNYPETFLAAWSSAPDPVDFRNFINADLYAGQNLYYNADSSLRADGTVAGYFPWVYSRDYHRMEDVIYRGEQMRSFDAVFGRKGRDGTPEKMCKTSTGEVDSTVMQQWKKYDISLLLRSDWEKYKPAIDNKLRISAGTADNFALDKAVRLLESEMKKLNANIEFAYFPGDHFTVATKEYFQKGYGFLSQRYSKWLEKNPAP